MYLLKLSMSNKCEEDSDYLLDKAMKIRDNLWDKIMVSPSLGKLNLERKSLRQPNNPNLDIKDTSYFRSNGILTFTMIFDVVNSEEPPEKLMFDLTLKGFSVELYHLSGDLLYFSSRVITPSTHLVTTERSNLKSVYGANPNHIERLECVPFTYPAPELSESENQALLVLLNEIQN